MFIFYFCAAIYTRMVLSTRTTWPTDGRVATHTHFGMVEKGIMKYNVTYPGRPKKKNFKESLPVPYG